jgi:hypothetical protein
VNFGTDVDKRWWRAVGASCTVQSGKKWREEERGAMAGAQPLFKRVRR